MGVENADTANSPADESEAEAEAEQGALAFSGRAEGAVFAVTRSSNDDVLINTLDLRDVFFFSA